MRAHRQYLKSGKGGKFTTTATVSRARGQRFDMPQPGIKSIIMANVILTYLLSRITV